MHTERRGWRFCSHISSSLTIHKRTCSRGSSTTLPATAHRHRAASWPRCRSAEADGGQRLELLKAIQQGVPGTRGTARRSVAAGGGPAGRRAARVDATPDITLGIDVVRDFEFRDMQADLKKVIDRSDLAEQPRIARDGCPDGDRPQGEPGHDRARARRRRRARSRMRDWAANLLGGIDRAEAKRRCWEILPVAPERLQGRSPRPWCGGAKGPMPS